MKRWFMIMMMSTVLAMWAGAQDVWVRPYFFADDPFSDFSGTFTSGGCLILSDTSTDCDSPGCPGGDDCQCGWANRHIWFITNDGFGPAVFDPDSTGETLTLEVTLEINPNMQPDRTIEAGIFVLEKPFPRYPRDVNDQCNWWADGVFMVANEAGGGSGGEIAAFGGRLPFWNGGGIRYTGGQITLVFIYDGSQKRVKYQLKQGNNLLAESDWLAPGDSSSTFNCGPHGLRYFYIGGYLQINRINLGNTAGGSAQFCQITLNGKTVVGQGFGDVNVDSDVTDADLSTLLLNYGR